MATKTVQVETTAQAYLALLRERGIEYFFANAETDFAPLIDAFARFTEEGKPIPKPITVPHENAAVAMAHGYYLVTGKPQVVMVHVNVGTANAINGVINASRDRVPVLFTAGRTPITEAGLPVLETADSILVVDCNVPLSGGISVYHDSPSPCVDDYLTDPDYPVEAYLQ